MASSVYSSTPETTNANRACRAVLGPCTDGLRDALRHYVPPSTFPHVIKLNRLNLPRLTADQQDLILPKHGNYTGTYSDMDISLLYILLRNISNMSPHSKGWGNDPDHHDSSLSACIERIRQVRNRCVHLCDPFMSNSDFNAIWSTIRSAMVDLDAFLVNGNQYEREVDFLRLESMDPERDLQYEEELRKQVEEDTKTREMVVTLENKMESLTTSIIPPDVRDKMEKLTESVIPPNVREQYDIDIQKWRKEDKLYYETHSFPSVMEMVRNQQYVTFVGVPGSGKSAMAHHIALKLQEEEGYEIVPTKDVRKMEDYGDPRNPQVFVIDDVVGVFGLQKTKLDVLTDYELKITKPCMAKSRTLTTCREAVYNEVLPYKSFLTKEETVIRLHSSDHALDDKDKKHILQKYGLNVNLMSPALLKLTSHMFPFLCKLFSKETKFQILGSKFFLNPVQCIIDEIDNVQRHNQLNYATLVLCMLNENSLSENILDDQNNEHFKKIKTNTLKYCKLESQTDSFQFMDALSAMEGTYTKHSGAQYTFIHDSMFEICAYHYGKQFPDQMLLYMSSSYIANSVKPQTSEPGIAHKEKESDSQGSEGDKRGNNSDRKKESDDKSSEREESFDLCIKLREDQYPLLAERLYRDIQNMELYDVFRNQVLKHPQVCQAFIGVLGTKSYTELKSLFLSSHGEVDKVVSKRACVEEESEDRSEWGEWRRQEVLVDERKILWGEYRYNVRVISWVISYGHYQIIEYILQQTAQHNETSELFEITGNSPHQSKIYTYNKQGSENNRPVEQCRLLVLSCYSGDVQTVKVLLPVCKKAINGIGQISRDIDWCDHTPLTAACEGGRVDVVKELVKAGADFNLQDRWGNTPLIAACKEGHVSVVEELVKAGAGVNLQDDEGNTPLIAACKRGHVRVVEELVKAGADVNLQDRRGNTPMIAALKKGHVNVVEQLMKAGTDVNLQDYDRKTPLITACMGGHVSVVEALLKARANVNLQITPLITACERGHKNVVTELVKAGADVNLQDKRGNTPLIAACERGHMSVVEELVKAGADVNLKSIWGTTPLIAACKGGHVSVVEELVKVRVDVNLQDTSIFGTTPLIAACKEGHVSVVKELVTARADVNVKGSRGNTPLIAACKEGHLSVVEELVQAGTDVNIQDTSIFGTTPLIAACKEGHAHVVKELVKAGADLNLQDDNRNTPLIAAAKGGHVSVVEELVKARADFNLHDDDGNTPLIAACKKGHVSVVEELVKAGAGVNLQDYDRNTPLIAACKGVHVSVVEELVKAGADVNLPNDNGNTPLIVACEGGHASVAEELLKAGADINIKGSRGNTPLIAACKGRHASVVKELVKRKTDVNLQDDDGNTPLIAACKEGHVSVVEELMKAGADFNLQDNNRNTPLMAACKRGHASVVEELVNVGADFNIQDNNRNTPLMAACKRGHVSVVEELVKAGADVNLQDSRGNTPLIAACYGGHVSVVEKLVKVGADVHLQNYKYTPLIAACKGGHLSVVKLLVKVGSDVNLQNDSRNRPLIAACEGGHASVVEELLKAGADVNVKGSRGNTPLIAACKGGHVSVVEKLVKVGADVNLQNYKYTPLIAACKGGHVSVVKLLVTAGSDVNLQDIWGDTPLLAAVGKYSLSTVKYLVEHGADWVTEVVDTKVSAVYRALIVNKLDIVKYLIQEQNKVIPGKCTGNLHLFNCLVEIRHAGVKTDTRDDVVTDRSVWCMDYREDVWRTISRGDCDALRHLLCVGLDVNQSIQWYGKIGVKHLLCVGLDVNQSIQLYDEKYKSDVIPLLYTLIEGYVEHRTEKVSIMLGVGVDINARVRYREYDSVLDREGVSVLERTRRQVCKYSESKYDKDRVPEYKKVLSEIKKHVRRHSV